MKIITASLIACAVISTASFASQRSYDLRESPTYFGRYSEQCSSGISGTCNDYAPAINAFTVIKDEHALTNFEKLKKLSEENDNSTLTRAIIHDASQD